MINAWQFQGPSDTTGREIIGLQKLSVIQTPARTVYLADNSSRPSRPIFTANSVIGGRDLNDVWAPSHLPYSGSSLNSDRRVSAAVHGKGPNAMFFDGHADLMRARTMTVDDWRDRRW